LLIVNSNGELEVNGRSILLLYIADIKHGGLMNGHSFVHNVDIVDIKLSEIMLPKSISEYRSVQCKIGRPWRRSTDFSELFLNTVLERSSKSGCVRSERSLLADLDRDTRRLSVEYNKVQRGIVRLIDSEEHRIGDYEGRKREISIGSVPASSGNSIGSSDLSAAENN